MRKMRSGTVIGDHNDYEYAKFLQQYFDKVQTTKRPFASTNCLLFTGGPDVTPSFYGEDKKHKSTFSSPQRDARELFLWAWAKKNQIPCIGICRGAQLLNVANGGALIQHVNNHTTDHNVVDITGSRFKVNSTHHQMMIPTKVGAVLAWAEEHATTYEGGEGEEEESQLLEMDDKGKVKEPEIVWYPYTMDLCIQYHPERLDRDNPGVKFLNKYIEDLFL